MEAQIYPEEKNAAYRISERQKEILAKFGDSRQALSA
jgi:hypothetical protein